MPVSSFRLRWPLLFPLRPSTLDLLDHADYVYDLVRQIDAPGDAVFRRFFNEGLAHEVASLRGFVWQTPPGEFAGAIIDERLAYMSLRMRTVAYEPGVRLATSIDRCSLPLALQMLQVMDATPLDGGRCHFRWRVAIRYLPGTAVMAPVVTPVFRRIFEESLDAVERHFAGAPRRATS